MASLGETDPVILARKSLHYLVTGLYSVPPHVVGRGVLCQAVPGGRRVLCRGGEEALCCFLSPLFAPLSVKCCSGH